MKTIELSKGNVAIVDDEEFEQLAQYRWSCNANGYAYRNLYLGGGRECSVRKLVLMHHLILPPKKGFFTDHTNGNRADNRRENLRYCTRAQNRANSKTNANNISGFKGVSFRPKKYGKQFAAGIVTEKNGKKARKHLGCFHTPEEAHAAYCKAASERYGEFARFN